MGDRSHASHYQQVACPKNRGTTADTMAGLRPSRRDCSKLPAWKKEVEKGYYLMSKFESDCCMRVLTAESTVFSKCQWFFELNHQK